MARKFIFIKVILLLLIFTGILMAVDDKSFGEIAIQFDDKLEQKYIIERALLFRNVSLSNDSTVTIQNEEGMEVFFYPQLNDGNQNILRLVAKESSDASSNFFDIFINLGDTIPDNLLLQNRNDIIYIQPNGQAFSYQPDSKNINGQINIKQETKSEAVSGSIDLNFDYLSLNKINEYQKLHLVGSFAVPVGKYEETSLATEASRKNRESRYKKNVYAGLVISIFLIAIFGLK